MSDQEWDDLSLEEKVDRLHRELQDYLDRDRQNLDTRNWRHEQLLKRVDELEKALKQMESRFLPGP